MGSTLESPLTPELHALLRRVLEAQTAATGAVETPVVVDLLTARACRAVLDVGCGEGSFLSEIARRVPTATFLGIDHSDLAIADARARLAEGGPANLSFDTRFFDSSFDGGCFDAITTRYTLQHSSHPDDFVRTVFEHLRPGGMFVALESLDAYTDCHRPEPVWEKFRAAVATVHARVGSNANVGKSLGVRLRRAGFEDIQVRVMLCGPSSVGWERFRDVVLATSELAFAFFPDLFSGVLFEEVRRWVEVRSLVEEADPYLSSAIASGIRP